ncbi:MULTISPECIES: TetR/AcrR family transcriptional regulator [Rhodococcus]|uniref:TetR/AcrR family transcriptional regulator n=1 Tax=Rhodococcus TaxID=1827 RepID=UPI000C9A0CAE|nr:MULTISPECIES: TetR/AcrR family transcriptional regulator [Rhodococcus]PND49718.1 TetR family transcriptional regulator [Rhodococcus sp. ENV425]WKW99219.1 TetR family transcriptional regulator [Rhodococcus aetherivorans]
MAEQTRTGSRGTRTRSTARTSTEAAPAPRRRPKNRKAQIAAVAAEAFSERGYHGVGIDEIAAAVGISGPALYRHFPNKYALFRDAALSLGTTLGTAVAEADEDAVDDPAEWLDRLLLAAIRTTVECRRTAGLYRWENRYLTAEDRSEVRSVIWGVNRRVGAALAALRPDLPEPDNVLLSAAMLSVVGSITAHRAPLSNRRIERLLLDACRSVAAVRLEAAGPSRAAALRTPGLAVANKREVLLHEAILLFHARGYHDVSIEEIGAAAGINASGVYRHFASKSDLLAAAFHRAADRLSVAVNTALADSTSPAEALRALTDVYVRLSFAQSELMSVYFTEIGSLPAAHRTDLRNIQRLNVEEWARLLADVRPGLSAVECRFLVHAALNLVLDIGRLMHFEPTPSNESRVQQLMLVTLLGNSAPREANS